MPNPIDFRTNDPSGLAGQAPLANLFQDLGESTRMGKLSNKQGHRKDDKQIQAPSRKHLTNIASIEMLLSMLKSCYSW